MSKDLGGNLVIDDSVTLDLDGFPVHYDGEVVGKVVSVEPSGDAFEITVEILSNTMMERLRQNAEKDFLVSTKQSEE